LGHVVVDDFARDKSQILGTNFGAILAVEKRKEGVAPALGHGKCLMQERAGKHDRSSGWGTVGGGSEFRKTQIAAFIVPGVEIHRDGESAVRRALRRIIAVGAEETAGCTFVAGYNVAFDAGSLELKRFKNCRHKLA